MEIQNSARLPELQNLVGLLKDALCEASHFSEESLRVSRSIFTALDKEVGSIGNTEPARLQACSYLDAALETVRQGPSSVNQIADTLAAIEPNLTWRHPSVLKKFVDDAYDTIANAILIGPNGLERRNDVMIGMTIMGPQTLYPDHQHSPEEVYSVLSKGEWRQNENSWHEPGIGGYVYNPSNIIHSFRSGSEPLLAIWCLWRT